MTLLCVPVYSCGREDYTKGLRAIIKITKGISSSRAGNSYVLYENMFLDFIRTY